MDPDFQAAQEELQASHQKLLAAKDEAIRSIQESTAALEARLPLPTKPAIPKGFIEVTKRGSSNPVEKVLVAVHSIVLIENFDWVENEPFSKLAVQLSQYAGVAYELEVLEPYNELKRLLAAAS